MQPIQGIDESTQAQNFVPFDIESNHKEYLAGNKKSPFCNAYCVNIECKPVITKKARLKEGIKLAPNTKATLDDILEEDIRYTLNLRFESPDGVQVYTESIWDIEDGDPKALKKQQMLNSRVAHFFEAYMGANTAAEYLNIKKVLGKNESNYKNYLGGLAEIMNTCKNGKPMYMNGEDRIPVRIKLTRNRFGGNPNSISMPLGNVIERVVAGAKSSTLIIQNDDEFHFIEKAKATASLGPSLGEASGGFGPQATAADNSAWDDVDDAL